VGFVGNAYLAFVLLLVYYLVSYGRRDGEGVYLVDPIARANGHATVESYSQLQSLDRLRSRNAVDYMFLAWARRAIRSVAKALRLKSSNDSLTRLSLERCFTTASLHLSYLLVDCCLTHSVVDSQYGRFTAAHWCLHTSHRLHGTPLRPWSLSLENIGIHCLVLKYHPPVWLDRGQGLHSSASVGEVCATRLLYQLPRTAHCSNNSSRLFRLGGSDDPMEEQDPKR
jgi:hypothetical protein